MNNFFKISIAAFAYLLFSTPLYATDSEDFAAELKAGVWKPFQPNSDDVNAFMGCLILNGYSAINSKHVSYPKAYMIAYALCGEPKVEANDQYLAAVYLELDVIINQLLSAYAEARSAPNYVEPRHWLGQP